MPFSVNIFIPGEESSKGHSFGPPTICVFTKVHVSVTESRFILNQGIETPKHAGHPMVSAADLELQLFSHGKHALRPSPHRRARTGAAQSTRARVPPCPAAPVPGRKTGDRGTRDFCGICREISLDLGWTYLDLHGSNLCELDVGRDGFRF